jgi:hypothetical protein
MSCDVYVLSCLGVTMHKSVREREGDKQDGEKRESESEI